MSTLATHWGSSSPSPHPHGDCLPSDPSRPSACGGTSLHFPGWLMRSGTSSPSLGFHSLDQIILQRS